MKRGLKPHARTNAAAQKIRAVAKETKSPWFERAALLIMAAPAAVTPAIAALQVRYMLRRQLREEERDWLTHAGAAAPTAAGARPRAGGRGRRAMDPPGGAGRGRPSRQATVTP